MAAALFRGGARLVQLRNKNAGAAVLLSQAEAIRASAPKDARTVVNDRADVALLAGASGVHLGQDDLPPSAARRILGVSAIVGVSTHNLDQALAAAREPVDYIAVGPIFPTANKANPDPAVGLAGLGAICRRVAKPVVAIGGITLESAPAVFAAGAASIAAIGDLLAAPDIGARVRQWLKTAP
jgi:thiamine-phosphate pyrophosphorylase